MAKHATPRRTPAQSLGAGISRFQALDVTTLPHYPASVAVNVIDPDVADALLWDIATRPRTTPTTVDVLPINLPRRPVRSLVRRLIVLPVALLAVGATMASAPRAEAAVVPLSARPLVLVVSGPTTRVGLDVVSTARAFRDGGHLVTLTDGPLAMVGTGTGSSAALVHLAASVPSRTLTPGTTTATLTDVGDGSTRTIPVTVLRQSRVSAPMATVYPGGVVVEGVASHYDARTNGLTGDVASPVQVQVLRGVRWVTATTATTDAHGQLLTFVPGSGTITIRLVRPAGATVTGRFGIPVTVQVPATSGGGYQR